MAETNTDTTATTTDSTADTSQGDTNGDLEGALKAAKAAKRKVDGENKSLRERIRAMEASLEEYQSAGQSELEKAVAKARKEAASEVEARYQERFAQQAILTRAQGDFENPDDVLKFMDVAEVDTSDAHAIDKALTDLAVERPYLLSRTGKAKLEGGADQGPQGRAGGGNPGTGGSDWLRGSFRGGK